MEVKELVKILQGLKDPEATIDIASDEEGNAFGDISDSLGEGTLRKNNKTVYSLYPETAELAEDRYN